jgi:hypothetical protein
MELQLPQATRNFYVDGHKPAPHWTRRLMERDCSVGSEATEPSSASVATYVTNSGCWSSLIGKELINLVRFYCSYFYSLSFY